jgi:putrescine oxidase
MTKPADSFSVLSALVTVSGAGSVANLFDPSLCLHSRVVGGSQVLALRLADRLGSPRIKLQAPVRAVHWSADAVSVDFDQPDVNSPIAPVKAQRVHARRLIVAVPPNLIPNIRFMPPLPAWRVRAFAALTPGAVTKCLAVYPRPFWRTSGLSGEGFSPHHAVREVYDNTPPKVRLVRVSYPPLSLCGWLRFGLLAPLNDDPC